MQRTTHLKLSEVFAYQPPQLLRLRSLVEMAKWLNGWQIDRWRTQMPKDWGGWEPFKYLAKTC